MRNLILWAILALLTPAAVMADGAFQVGPRSEKLAGDEGVVPWDRPIVEGFGSVGVGSFLGGDAWVGTWFSVGDDPGGNQGTEFDGLVGWGRDLGNGIRLDLGVERWWISTADDAWKPYAGLSGPVGGFAGGRLGWTAQVYRQVWDHGPDPDFLKVGVTWARGPFAGSLARIGRSDGFHNWRFDASWEIPVESGFAFVPVLTVAAPEGGDTETQFGVNARWTW